MTDRSPVEATAPAPFPSVLSTALPEELSARLDAGRPMVLFFYDTTEPETKAVRAELDAVLKENRGLVDLVTFDVTQADGTEPSPTAKQAAVLAIDLGVKGTPYIIVVDRNGFITWRMLGFVDRDVIGREVLRATE